MTLRLHIFIVRTSNLPHSNKNFAFIYMRPRIQQRRITNTPFSDWPKYWLSVGRILPQRRVPNHSDCAPPTGGPTAKTSRPQFTNDRRAREVLASAARSKSTPYERGYANLGKLRPKYIYNSGIYIWQPETKPFLDIMCTGFIYNWCVFFCFTVRLTK